MHMLIYALVGASTAEEALATGKTVFDRLAGQGPDDVTEFDYYVTFDEDSPVAGSTRWGERPVAAPVESEAGQDLLDSAWEATKTEFERNLKRVRDGLDELTTEEIMRDRDLVRHACYNLGAYRGPSIALYTECADGIRDPLQLARVLETEKSLWIVPADVHY